MHSILASRRVFLSEMKDIALSHLIAIVKRSITQRGVNSADAPVSTVPSDLRAIDTRAHIKWCLEKLHKSCSSLDGVWTQIDCGKHLDKDSEIQIDDF